MKQTTFSADTSARGCRCDHDDAIMTKFQDLMGQFLDIQKSVMLAYLNGNERVSPSAGRAANTPSHEHTRPTETYAQETRVFSVHPGEDAPFVMADPFEPSSMPSPSPDAGRDAPSGPMPGPEQSTGASPYELTGILLKIVGDRTGYPEDMLSLDLEIESDLGIDSIKRMQIMEEMENELESARLTLTDADRESLVGSRTLGDIIAMLETLMGKTPKNQPATESVQSPAPPSQGPDIAPVLLRIVGDRTGYPEDMLSLDLEIESDLGIDSIKRMQIMEEVENELESLRLNLTDADREVLVGSRTLGEIITKIESLMDNHPGQPTVENPEEPAPSSPPDTVDVESLLLGIVSDLSGYPANMLDLDLSIEADLGIDSIKRMQIMEHLEASLEKHKAAPTEQDLEHLTQCMTLGDIVAHLGIMLNRSPVSSGRDEEDGPDEVHEQPSASPEPDKARSTAKPDPLSAVQSFVRTFLYEIIEKETGFPKELLEPDLSLKDDLDIEASQKEHILDALMTELEKKLGNRINLNCNDRSELRVLDDVVMLMVDCMDDNISLTAIPPAGRPEETGPVPEIRRFAITVRERPLIPAPRHYKTKRPVLVTEMAGSLNTRNVVGILKDHGCTPVILSHDPAKPKAKGHRHTLDLTDFSQLKSTLATLRKKHGPLTGLVHMLPLATEPGFRDMDMNRWKHSLTLETKSLFYLAKLMADDLGEAAQNGEADVVAVSAMGGTFASGESWDDLPSCFPGQGAMSGFLKALAEEIPGINIRALDLNPGLPGDIMAQRISEEFLTPSADIEAGYRDDRRLTLDIMEARLDTESQVLDIGPDSHILLTGGARGITAAVAMELARRYRPTLFLVGRTPLDDDEDAETCNISDEKQLKAILAQRLKQSQDNVKPADVEKAYKRLTGQREIRTTLFRLEETGAKAHYFSADVTREEDVIRLCTSLYREYGTIDGVIHGAGLIEDKKVRDKDIESFNRVFDTKADSLFTLSRALKTESLKFMALFSSVAGRFGNAGQSDYGAANEVYNKTARHLNSIWPCRVMSFIWGPWESRGGMVSEDLKQKFHDQGIYLIPRKTGAAMCVDELVYGTKADVEVIYGGWDDRIKTVNTAKQADTLPLFNMMDGLKIIEHTSFNMLAERA